MAQEKPGGGHHSSSGASLSAYYNASQLRADAWNRLKHNAARLADATLRKGETDRLRSAVEETLTLLEPVESYWAFPGNRSMAQLWEFFEEQDHAGLARATARLNRALVSESYRLR